MSSSAFSQFPFKSSIYTEPDSSVKAVFESGRKSRIESVYQTRKYPLIIGYFAITKYYRQNDSFVVNTTYDYPSKKSSERREYEIEYFNSDFRLIGSEVFKIGNYRRNDYKYDDRGRSVRHTTYRDTNTTPGVIETEYHDKEGFFIERGYRYTRTYYDSSGEYCISYSASDSSKDWTDTVNHKKFGKLWEMALSPPGVVTSEPGMPEIKDVTHDFDSENRPIKKSFIDKDKHVIKTTNYIYRFDGRMLEENTVRANGDTLFRELYFYDNRSNLIETRRTKNGSSLNAVSKDITTYEYDKMNRLLFRKRDSGDGLTIMSNKYDDRGDLVERKLEDNGVLKALSQYTYEY